MIALFVLLLSCSIYPDEIPGDIRTPTDDEWMLLDEVATQWDEVAARSDLPPLTPACFAEHRRLLVMPVENSGIRRWCGRCGVGECGSDVTDECSKWGCAAGCAIRHAVSGFPVAVVHYSAPERLVAQESVHHLAHCMGVIDNYRIEALWGADGVFPL